MRVVHGTHHLVQLFTGTDSHELLRQVRSERLRHFDDPHRWNLRNENLAALHAPERVEHELHTLLQRDPEPRHLRVRDRQFLHAVREHLLEDRDHRAARADHVAVAYDREARLVAACDIVRGDEELVGAELRRAVEIDRIGSLVRGKCDHLFDFVIERGLDHVLRAVHVGLDALHRVVLRGGDLLERGGVDHEVDAVHRGFQAGQVAHVADEESQGAGR